MIQPSTFRLWVSLMVCLIYSSLHGQAFVTNGSATSLGGDCYQLTPDSPGQSGSIFSQNPIDLTQPFYEEATFFFGCKDANGADGIVFILARSNTALGVGGGGLGYESISPSIAIEYDDYFNGNFADPTSDHMAVVSMGSVNHGASTGLVAPIDLPNIEDCMDHCFAVSWDPVSMRLSASLDGEEISYTGDIINTIFSGTTLVYYGFSSGTGSLSNIHTVCFSAPAVEEMPDETICDGESLQLQADPNGIAWTWAPDPTLSSLDESDPTATPEETTTYTTIIEYACNFFGYDTVTITVLPPPDVSADNNGPLCEGEDLSLTADGGTTYEWEGPDNFSSFLQNPFINNITVDVAGTYTVTVTDASGCTATATTEVIVDTGPDIVIDPPPMPICDNQDPIQFTADPPGGIWEGDIDEDGLFDPGFAGEGVHTITYTVSSAIGCSNTEEIEVIVYAAPEVLIDPPGILCETSSPVQLTGTPPGGVWIGEVTIGGIFDPGDAGEGFHLITYIAEDANGCTNEGEITIEVVPGLIAEITPAGPFCFSDSVIQFIADPPGGEWGGDANMNGEVFPGDLDAGFYQVTYTFVDAQGCFYGQEDFEIINAPMVQIDPISPLCLNESAQTLTASPGGGAWSGAADAMGTVDPSALGSGSHEVIYTYVNAAGCEGADTIQVIILPPAPVISNLISLCDSTATSYTVTFVITGGDPLDYSVQGSVPGTLLPGNPSIFISDPIPSGNTYTFWVDDSNHCDPDTVTGSELCNCGTNAGNMDLTLITACLNDEISLLPPTGVVLDPDDSLVYVIHLGFPDSILLVSDSLTFSLAAPLMAGVTYFVSSVAGNASGGIGVDLTDPCLSVSFGTPIMWVDSPTGLISGTTAICEGESATLDFTLTGTGPFDVTYTDGSNTYQLNAVSSGHTISVVPSLTTVYTLIQITETLPPGCIGNPATTHTVEVFENYLTPLTAQICFGDSVLVGGTFQTVPGVYVDSLLSVNGCDSLLSTTLTLFNLDTVYLNDTSCDSSQTGVFTDVFTDRNGCDSTTITTVTYVLADTTLLQSNTCDELSAGVFTDVYTGQSGCDSVVIETVTFVPADSTWIIEQTCDSFQVGTDTLVQMNVFGCDSFIIKTRFWVAGDTTILNGETCDPAAAGVFMELFTTWIGCDSLVITTISLLPSDTTTFFQLTCSPQDTGLTEQVFTNSYGCDSLLWTITSLAPEDSCLVPVIHREIYFPNIFSPNGDGLNDFFFISSHPEAVTGIPVLRIFDRWGGLAFERMDVLPNIPEHGWDGKVKGEPINPGVFVWIAEVVYTDGKTETLTGDVTLLR